MKKIICIAIACMCLCGVSIAKCKPPENVIKAFNQKFPSATDVEWDKENSHEFEASFKLKDQKYSANYSNAGEWLETESPLSYEQLPEKVKNTFKSSYPKAEVEGVSKIENHKGEISFEIEIEKLLRDKEVFFNDQGVEISEQ